MGPHYEATTNSTGQRSTSNVVTTDNPSRPTSNLKVQDALPGTTTCQGKTPDGARCPLEAVPEMEYCSLQHVPDIPLPDPCAFDMHTLCEASLVKQDGTIDRYTKTKVDVYNRDEVELDHIVGKQVAASVLYFVYLNKRLEPASYDAMKERFCTIINQDGNLCLTTKAIALAKREAVTQFLVFYNFNKEPTVPFIELLTTQFMTMEGYTACDAERLARAVIEQVEQALQVVGKTLHAAKKEFTTKDKKTSSKRVNDGTAATVTLLIKELARAAAAIMSTRKKTPSRASDPDAVDAQETTPCCELL